MTFCFSDAVQFFLVSGNSRHLPFGKSIAGFPPDHSRITALDRRFAFHVEVPPSVKMVFVDCKS